MAAQAKTKRSSASMVKRPTAARVKAKKGHPSAVTVGRPISRLVRPAATGKSSGFIEAKPVQTPSHQPGSHGGTSNFTKAVRFLHTLSDFERLRIVRYTSQNFDLDRMRTLLKKLGNPQDQYRSVHIAGTKGKGSTCAMIAAMLRASGYKVGVYSSPHLTDIRERMSVDGELISHADFGRLVKLVEPIVARSRPVPTYFDVLTAVAFKYFRRAEDRHRRC